MNGHPLTAGLKRQALGSACGLALALGVLLPAAPAAAAAPDVRIVVDVSASMGETDPQNRRSEAVGMLLRLLPDDGDAGVWTYGKFVNMLVKYGPSTALWKENAAILTRDLESVGARSNLLEAIERATWDRQAADGPAHVVVLTDGRLNVSDDPGINQSQARHLLAELAPQLAAAGYRVHSLALSDRADEELLGQLAALTGGFHGRIEEPAALPEGLLSVLGWVAAPARLPLAGQGTFQVAPGTRELTLLRLNARLEDDVALVDPTGARFDRLTGRDRIRWHVGGDYELVSLPEPAPGTWRFEGSGSQVRLYAYGDLTAEYPDLPGTLFPGGLRSFDLALTSGGEVVRDGHFLDLVTVSARLQNEAGDTPLVVEAGTDGRFKVNLLGPDTQGEYLLETRISGPTFDQTLTLPLVLKNPLSVEVRPAEDGFVIWARIAAAELDHDSLRLAAMVKRPPGAARLLPLERMPAGLWKLAVPGARGLVEVSLDLQGNYLNDRSFELRTEPIRVVLPVTDVQYVNLGLDGRPLLVADPPADVPAPASAPARPPAAVMPAPAPAAIRQDPAVMLPVWLAWVAGFINVVLGVSVWWLVGQPRPREDVEPVLDQLRQRLGLAAPGQDPDASATPA